MKFGRAWAVTVALSALASTCLASSRRTQETEEVGVVLGLSEPTLETIWITFPEGLPVVSSRGPGLLVPRGDTFWWVGVTNADEESEAWYDTYLWAAPAGVTPNRAPPERAVVGDLPAHGGYRGIDVAFVGPDYVSVEESLEVFGPAIAYNHAINVFALAALTEPSRDRIFEGLPLEAVLGPGSANALEDGASAAAKRDEGFATESFIAGASLGWGIRRERGRFRLIGRAGYSSGAARGYYVDFDIPRELPSDVGGSAGRSVPWFWAQEQVPNTIDVIGSPSGRTVLIATPGSLYVYRGLDTGLGERLGTLPIDLGGLVMVQWARGEQVERWSGRIEELLRDGPP